MGSSLAAAEQGCSQQDVSPDNTGGDTGCWQMTGLLRGVPVRLAFLTGSPFWAAQNAVQNHVKKQGSMVMGT